MTDNSVSPVQKPQRFVVLIGLCVIGAILSACAPTLKAQPEAGLFDPGFNPPKDVAAVYILRYSHLGGPVPGRVGMDGKTITSLGVNSFVQVLCPPGLHKFSATGDENEDVIQMDVQAGKYYFLRLRVGMGWVQPRFFIEPLGEDYARRAFPHLTQVLPKPIRP